MSINVIDIPFVTYPVTDLARARDFYERIIGLECTMDHPLPDDDGKRWIEYDIGTSALAITNIVEPQGGGGVGVALEVGDIDLAKEKLEGENVEFRSEMLASPSCRFFVIADPDGNDITIHQHNPAA